MLHMLGQDMDAEALRERVRGKIAEIDQRIQALRSIQDMLAGLLQTPSDEVHNYLKSFRPPDKD
ncbi:hypothetical protein [Paenibacillus graminis]|uniref:hypothetical protein n=2 Tax=Paenibacillus graminis TaxID=189425 RepID=UPI002DBE18EF|nr:hypothetical protein [Paenibacillus graminis]